MPVLKKPIHADLKSVSSNSFNMTMASETILVEPKLLGLTVTLSNGRFGTIKELRSNRPWHFSVERDGQLEPLLHFSKISVGSQKFSDYLVGKGVVLDRDGWTSLVRINHTDPTEPDLAPEPSDKYVQKVAEIKYHVGRIKWFGGQNSHTGKTNEFGFITSSGGGDIYFHKSAVVFGLESLAENTLVAFSINKVNHTKPAASSVHVLRCIQEIATLRMLFTQGTDDARVVILERIKSLLPTEQFISFANNILEFAGQAELSMIYRSLGLALLISTEARPILCKLAAEEQLDLFASLDDLSDFSEEVIALLKSDGFQIASATSRARFWAKHIPKDQRSSLYPFLDIETKRSIWRQTVLPTLPIKVRIEALLREKGKLPLVDWTALVLKLIKSAVSTDGHLQLLGAMPTAFQLEFIEKADDWRPYADITCVALAQAEADDVPHELLDKFWLKYRPIVTTDILYKFAPHEIQLAIWRDTVLPTLPIRERIEALLRDSHRLPAVGWRNLTFKIIRCAKNYDESQQILCAVATELKIEFFSLSDNLIPYEDMVCEALANAAMDGVPQLILNNFWRKHQPNNPKDPIFKFAPLEIKQSVCRTYYACFIHRISSLFDQRSEKPASIAASVIYEALTDSDRKLARIWQHGTDPYVEAQMLSARGAELAAMRFYQEMNYSVTDIATLQLEGKSGDWRTHDLLLDNKIPVDVKNSRCPKNNANFYVEHTVPRFKQDRRSKPVRIAGILSPYLQLEYLNAPSKTGFEIEPIRYLGETSWPMIEELIKRFSSEKFEVRHAADRVVPHWLFDYPDSWYRDYFVRIQQLREVEWPSDAEWAFLYDANDAMSVVPQLCVVGFPLPAYFQTVLSAWQIGLYRKEQNASPDRPHLPATFLTILTDFLEQLEKSSEEYSPCRYKPFLFGPNFQVKDSLKSPLGLIDPVGLIGNFCSSLEILWDHRHEFNLGRFKSFRFSGLGLLQGRETLSSEWETILAYCGGRAYGRDDEGNVLIDDRGKPIKDYGKCGESPLVLGQNKICEICHKLICGSCGFCCLSCERRRFESRAPKKTLVVGSERDGYGEFSYAGSEAPSHIAELLPLALYEDYLDRV